MARHTIGRRGFLKASVAAAGGVALTAAKTRALGSNERIAVGIIGAGIRGNSFVPRLAELAAGDQPHVDLVAVCDLWRVARESTAADVEKRTGRKPHTFTRHPDLLAKGGVDAVIITTPDLWHVPVLLDAIGAGQDAYVEKPLAVDLATARKARDAVRKSGRIVQVGTQRRSEDKWYAACEFVKTGRLGTISTVEAGFNDCSPRWRRETECKNMKAADFDWDFYTRDLKPRPFNPRHVLEWKLFRDFTMGTSGLLGCHMYDAAQLVLDAPFPTSAVAQGGVYVYHDGREVEDTFTALIDFGGKFILRYMTRLGNNLGGGVQIFGTNGMLDGDAATYSGAGSRTKDKLPDEAQKLDVSNERGGRHLDNWLDCIRTRKQPSATIEHGYQHMVTSCLAQSAMYENRRLRYEIDAESIA